MLTFDALFANTDADVRVPLDLDIEWALILEARGESGQRRQPHFDQLLHQYLPALRGAVTRELHRTNGANDLDEVRANVLAAFTEAVNTVEEGERVATRFNSSLMHASDEVNIQGSRDVPTRMARRYRTVMREAGHDLAKAAEIAPTHKLSVKALHAIHDTLTGYIGLDEAATLGLSETIAADDAYLAIDEAFDRELEVQQALAALPFGSFDAPSKERLVTDMAYGLEGTNPLVDEAIAEELRCAALDALEVGAEDASDMWVPTRSTVTRTRNRALDMMHNALCDGTDERCNRAHTD